MDKTAEKILSGLAMACLVVTVIGWLCTIILFADFLCAKMYVRDYALAVLISIMTAVSIVAFVLMLLHALADVAEHIDTNNQRGIRGVMDTVDQDRWPNFRSDDGHLCLVYCHRCQRRNLYSAILSGECAWCGWREIKDELQEEE